MRKRLSRVEREVYSEGRGGEEEGTHTHSCITHTPHRHVQALLVSVVGVCVCVCVCRPLFRLAAPRMRKRRATQQRGKEEKEREREMGGTKGGRGFWCLVAKKRKRTIHKQQHKLSCDVYADTLHSLTRSQTRVQYSE